MIEVLGLAVLVNMFVHWFQPIQWFKQKIWWYRLPDMFSFVNCTKCMGFWTALVVLQNLYLAAATALFAYLIESTIYFIEVKRNDL
jgi:hypothetical protein